jgi:hypothetical protein
MLHTISSQYETDIVDWCVDRPMRGIEIGTPSAYEVGPGHNGRQMEQDDEALEIISTLGSSSVC